MEYGTHTKLTRLPKTPISTFYPRTRIEVLPFYINLTLLTLNWCTPYGNLTTKPSIQAYGHFQISTKAQQRQVWHTLQPNLYILILNQSKTVGQTVWCSSLLSKMKKAWKVHITAFYKNRSLRSWQQVISSNYLKSKRLMWFSKKMRRSIC